MTNDANEFLETEIEMYGAQQEGIEATVPIPRRTPFFEASNAPRYQRQALIQGIEKENGNQLICYVSGSAASIERDDTIGFVDLLHNIPEGSNLDVLLHTGGGDIDAAEKLVSLARRKVGNSTLRFVIPDFAKSAGTLMCLGADRVVMSDTSELGPIDPQIVLRDADGNSVRYSVQSYLDAYEFHSQILTANPADVASQLMINKIDPMRHKQFEAYMSRAREIAQNHLKRGMFRSGGGNYSKTAAALLNTKRWLSHGQMISWEDAIDPEIGLIVDYIECDIPIWENYWRLYCLQRLAIKDREKIFESSIASLIVEQGT